MSLIQTQQPISSHLIFGGCFDPPHQGHGMVLNELCAMNFEKVILLPAGRTAYKPIMTPAVHRLKMLDLGLKGLPLEISRFEMDEAEKNPNTPQTTYQTLSKLQLTSLSFAIGSDQLQKLRSWFAFPEVLTLCHWLVIERADFFDVDHIEALLGTWPEFKKISKQFWKIRNSDQTLSIVRTQAPSLSSSSIRLKISQGEDVRSSLATGVWEYIQEHRLYQTKESV